MNNFILQTKAADGGDPLLAAVAEHAARFEKAAAASALEIKALKDDKAEIAERLSGMEQEFVALRDGVRGGDSRHDARPSAGALFTKSAGYQQMAAGATSTGRVALGGLSLKNIVNIGAGATGDSGYSVAPQREPGLFNDPRRTFGLIDLLQTVVMGSGTMDYVRMLGDGPIADYQLTEGATKKQSDVPTELVSASAVTLAHWVRASRQVASDQPSLMAVFDSLLMYGLKRKVEAELINGVGGQGKLLGLLPQATAYVSTETSVVDKLGDALADLASRGWMPGAIVLNSKDWQAIRSSKSTGSGEYLIGEPGQPAAPSLWNTPVVATPAIAQGTSLVFDPMQVAIGDRMQPSVLMSMEDGQNFVQNMVTVLAEERIALLTFSPASILSVDLTPST